MEHQESWSNFAAMTTIMTSLVVSIFLFQLQNKSISPKILAVFAKPSIVFSYSVYKFVLYIRTITYFLYIHFRILTCLLYWKVLKHHIYLISCWKQKRMKMNFQSINPEVGWGGSKVAWIQFLDRLKNRLSSEEWNFMPC